MRVTTHVAEQLSGTVGALAAKDYAALEDAFVYFEPCCAAPEEAPGADLWVEYLGTDPGPSRPSAAVVFSSTSYTTDI